MSDSDDLPVCSTLCRHYEEKQKVAVEEFRMRNQSRLTYLLVRLLLLAAAHQKLGVAALV